MNILAVFIGGGLGSLCRYAISLWLGKTEAGFPLATLVANILACIVLALGFILLERNIEMSKPMKLFVLTGFCGGFSTFSTFSMETYLLLMEGNWPMALLYVGLSILSCLLIIGLLFYFFS
ncbi:MAG: fluoride efflux transporter CrcB [Bacteroidota bacterium]